MNRISRLVHEVCELALLTVRFRQFSGKIAFHYVGIDAVQSHHSGLVFRDGILHRFPASAQIQENIAVFTHLAVLVPQVDLRQVLDRLLHPRSKRQPVRERLNAGYRLVVVSAHLSHCRRDVIQPADRSARLVGQIVKTIHLLRALGKRSGERGA